jgi:trehalose-phosphatase
MQTSQSYAAFLDRLRSAPARVLLLDYDGTLAPFTPDRDHAFPYPGVPELLTKIRDHGTRLVLISGRPARDLIPRSGLQPHPEIWGSHGLERLRPDGTYEVPELSAAQEAGLRQAAASLRDRGFEGRLELKPGGVAAHWRGLAPSEAARFQEQVLALWSPLTHSRGLALLPFDGGLEIRVADRSKADAVRTILREVPADAAIAYLGDDQTDEDAFGALKGKGLTILVRSAPTPTAADLWLKPPEELIEFLRQWLVACGG